VSEHTHEFGPPVLARHCECGTRVQWPESENRAYSLALFCSGFVIGAAAMILAYILA
jgi:hypothetical protein